MAGISKGEVDLRGSIGEIPAGPLSEVKTKVLPSTTTVGPRLDGVIREGERPGLITDLDRRRRIDRRPVEGFGSSGDRHCIIQRFGLGGTEHRQPGAHGKVGKDVAQHRQLQPVVGMTVGENDRVEVEQVDLGLQRTHRPRTTVEQHGRARGTKEIAGARVVGSRVRTRRTQDCDGEGHATSHRWAITVSSSGPRSRRPSRANVSMSPLDTNVCRPVRPPSASSPGVASAERTAKAVSSADDTSTTSRPITSAMVRARNG